jgi:hypothetical protein
MRLATPSDKAAITEIIAQSFLNNPTLNFCIRKKGRKMNYLRAIAEYAFEYAIKRNGVFISDDEKGAAICYHYSQSKQSLHDYWLLLKMIITAFSFRNVLKMNEHDHFIKNQRPADGNYFYFWFFGALPSDTGPAAASEIKNSIFKIAELLKTPIYAETTIEKNKRVYQRYGFEVYKQWKNHKTGITVWFMRKMCLKSGSF